MLEVSGGCDHDVGRRVDGPVVLAHHLAIEAFDRFARSENRLAQRMILPETADESLVYHVLRTVRFHLEFLENHPLFLSDIALAERGPQQHVGEDVESNR